jgi:hypothetical protein
MYNDEETEPDYGDDEGEDVIATKIDLINDALECGERSGAVPHGIRATALVEQRAGRVPGDWIKIAGGAALSTDAEVARVRRHMERAIPGCRVVHEDGSLDAGDRLIARRHRAAAAGWNTYVFFPDERPRPRFFRAGRGRGSLACSRLHDAWRDSRWATAFALLCLLGVVVACVALADHWAGHVDPTASLSDVRYCRTLIDLLAVRWLATLPHLGTLW